MIKSRSNGDGSCLFGSLTTQPHPNPPKIQYYEDDEVIAESGAEQPAKEAIFSSVQLRNFLLFVEQHRVNTRHYCALLD